MQENTPTNPLFVAYALWSQKWFIIGMSFVFALGTAVTTFFLPNLYESGGIYEHVREESGSLSSSSQLGQMASLAGLSFGTPSNTDPKSIDVVAIQSQDFLQQFIAQRDILVPLFAAEGYNPQTGELQLDNEVYNLEEQRWTREVSSPYTKIPSYLEAVERFKEFFTVDVDRITGLVTLQLVFYSPELSAKWLNDLVEDFNEFVRKKDIQRYTDNLLFLTDKANNAQNQNMQTVLYNLIEQEQKKQMLATVSKHYVLRAVETPFVPMKRSSPKRALLTASAGVAGLLLASLGVLLMFFVRGDSGVDG
ncbi:hypothetical protein LJ739_01035 [Aestuariibacter halophilus]|uniref:Polysaccharide chain length determinant N-terminal domain-containing protein n=1 Tax=Fluctibacter halophilus TaxID=226011 RepID=A0ABS8G6I4_9ALTE|nr:hypothetical protein [Aestuariibacter halophilus]MCC2614821.1 hypothetical protein [Aestuariibacter halophilus]